MNRLKILPRLESMITIQKGAFTLHQQQEFNRLVEDTKNIRHRIKQSFKRCYTGGRPWSPEWKAAQQEKALWFLLNKRWDIRARKLQGRVSVKEIRRLMKATNNNEAMTLSRELVRVRFEMAKKAYIKA